MLSATLIKAPMGIGKTTGVLAEVGAISGKVEIYVPTHHLARELHDIVKTKFPHKTVVAISGRSALGTNGKPMCKKHKLAAEVAAAGGEVYSSLCKKEYKRKGNTVFEHCKHYTTCAYINQFEPADIAIYSHAYLPLIRSSLEGPSPDYVVIDESFFQTCIEIGETPLHLLTNPELKPEVQKVLTPLTQAIMSGRDPVKALNLANIGRTEIDDALKSLGSSATITPSTTLKQAQGALARMRESAAIKRVLDLASTETRRPFSQAFTYNPQKSCIRTHRKLRIRHLQDFLPPGSLENQVPPRVLIIDGSASSLIVSQWFRIQKEICIAAERNAHVIQCSSARCSTTSLIPARNIDPASKKTAKRRLTEVQNLIDHLAEEHKSVLVVGPQKIVEKAKRGKKIRVPRNGVEFAHFNALRGVDRWKNFEAVLVIGRNEPPVQAVEDIARCVFKENYYPLDLRGTWTTEARGYRLSAGRQGTDVVVHPDQHVQAILEQLRERESEQALDRLRLIHAKKPKFVYLLSNLPLDVTVHQLLDWDDLMHGSRIERAWRKTEGGALPLDAEWLAENHPDLWPSPSAAKNDVQRSIIKAQNSNNIYIRNLSLNILAYKPSPGGRTRQGKWKKFLCGNSDISVAQQALSDVLGVPVRVKSVGKKK